MEERDCPRQYLNSMILSSIISSRQLAMVLRKNYRHFSYMVYVLPGPAKYRCFTVPKRGGGERQINSPLGPLLRLQQKLRPLLDELYQPRSSVNGFVKSRGIITNARVHLNSKWILNIDLKDFFHSIHFGRIKGRLKARPYNLSEQVAHAIANAACFSGVLPQGGALSPVLSNMVADRLDGELSRICRKHKCRYTRYADDITISTNVARFPRSLAFFKGADETRSLVIGQSLEEIFARNDFNLNPRKSRLNGDADRQEVTGIVVNEKMNVRRTFVRQIRAMLHAWEKFGFDAAQLHHLARWRSPKGRLFAHDSNDFEYILRGKLEFLRSVQGENQPVCRKLLLRFNALTGRRTAPFRLLPSSAIDLLNESTYCLVVTNFSPSTDTQDRMHTATAFFLEGIGIVTCAHCVGDEMEIYDPHKREIKYPVTSRAIDRVSDVAILEFKEELVVKPKAVLQVGKGAVSIGDEVRAAGFPEKYPEGALSVAKAEVEGFYDRSKHSIWHGDQTVRYMISKGIPKGVSGGPVLNAAGQVIGIGAKGPGADDMATPCEVVPISAVVALNKRSRPFGTSM